MSSVSLFRIEGGIIHLLQAALDVQAYFPFAIGVYQHCMQGSQRHLWYTWRLLDDASLHIQVHAELLQSGRVRLSQSE
jgi:hypothetical protein